MNETEKRPKQQLTAKLYLPMVHLRSFWFSVANYSVSEDYITKDNKGQIVHKLGVTYTVLHS